MPPPFKARYEVKKVFCANTRCSDPLSRYDIERQTTRNRYRFCKNCRQRCYNNLLAKCANPNCTINIEVTCRGKQKYCSDICRLETTWKGKDRFGSVCRQCGKDLTSKYNPKLYCNTTCKGKYYYNRNKIKTNLNNRLKVIKSQWKTVFDAMNQCKSSKHVTSSVETVEPIWIAPRRAAYGKGRLRRYY